MNGNGDVRSDTLSVLVENHAGVLSHIAGLFARRGFNIDSLAVGMTENPRLSRMTIVVTGDDHIVEQVEKQLNKQIDVIKVKHLKEDDLISRELMLIKVTATAQTRKDIMDIAQIMDARILDISTDTLTIELCDTTERCHLLQNLLRPYQVREVVTTGTSAIERGSASITDKRPGSAKPALVVTPQDIHYH